MAEVAFFFDAVDEQSLVAFLIEGGCVMIPSIRYESPTYEVLRGVAELREWRARTRHFFVAIPTAMGGQLSMFKVNKPNTEFAIMARRGGAAIELLLCDEIEGPKLIGGALMAHSTFYPDETGAHCEMPAVLMELFKAGCKLVRKSSLVARVQGTNRVWHVGKHAAARVLAGEIQLGMPGLQIEH